MIFVLRNMGEKTKAIDQRKLLAGDHGGLQVDGDGHREEFPSDRALEKAFGLDHHRTERCGSEKIGLKIHGRFRVYMKGVGIEK